MLQKKTKIIFLSIVGDYAMLPSVDADQFFMWGWGSVLAREIQKRTNSFEIEVWRTEPHVSEVRSRVIDGIRCRLFPCNILSNPASNITQAMIRDLVQESRMNRVILHNDMLFNTRTYTLAALLPGIPMIAQAHGDKRPDLAYSLTPSLKNWIKLRLAPLGLRHLRHAFVLTKGDGA
jgi:hypothetical protein